MAQTILYYPTINIQDGTWLRNAILYIGQELTSAIQAGAPLLNIGIGYFDYRNKISPAKADGGFSYI